MGTEETESSRLQLPLFSVQSTEDAGSLTPLHTLASIPFQWEEKPGKPRPCTDLIPISNSNIFNDQPKCLEPPPRLYNLEFQKATSSSPTTVLDGPYISNKPRFSSFRLLRDHPHHHHRHRRQGSFDSSHSCKSPETGQLYLLGKKKVERKSWWRKTSHAKRRADVKESNGTSFVFPSSMDSADCASSFSDDCSHSSMKMAKLETSGSISSLSQAKTHIWAAIFEGFKQVIPWKSKKSKKEVLIG